MNKQIKRRTKEIQNDLRTKERMKIQKLDYEKNSRLKQIDEVEKKIHMEAEGLINSAKKKWNYDEATATPYQKSMIESNQKWRKEELAI